MSNEPDVCSSVVSQIVTGLYLGNFRDAKDNVQLKQNKITHILSIHENAKPMLMVSSLWLMTNSFRDISQVAGKAAIFI